VYPWGAQYLFQAGVRGLLPRKILRSEMAVGGFKSVSGVIITTSNSIDFCGKKFESLKQHFVNMQA